MNTPAENDDLTLTRRKALAGAGFLGAGALTGLGANVSAALPGTEQLDLPVTPEDNLSNLVRMTASLDSEDAPWFFNGSVYAVVGEGAPVEIVRVQGLEMYHMVPRGPNSFMMHGLTTTFMTDVNSGEWLDELKNPFTGQLVDVPDYAATTPPGGGHHYETTGVRPVAAADQIPDKNLKLWWSAAGDYVWLHNETVYPPGLDQPRKQRQSNFARREDFTDAGIRSLSSAFTVSFWAPWPKWLGMGDLPGHVVWHASGAKLKSVDKLPAAFRERVEEKHPDMLKVDISGDSRQEV